MKFRRPHKANVDMAGKILTWRENSAASQSKHAWNGPWNALSPHRIFSCRHDVVMTTRDKNELLPFRLLFEVLFYPWQTITAMTRVMTDHGSVRKSFEWLLLYHPKKNFVLTRIKTDCHTIFPPSSLTHLLRPK